MSFLEPKSLFKKGRRFLQRFKQNSGCLATPYVYGTTSFKYSASTK